MKRNSSKPRIGTNNSANSSSGPVASKNKTMSTIVHTEAEHQRTTKKNSLSKGAGCSRVASSASLKVPNKLNILKIENRNSRA